MWELAKSKGGQCARTWPQRAWPLTNSFSPSFRSSQCEVQPVQQDRTFPGCLLPWKQFSLPQWVHNSRLFSSPEDLKIGAHWLAQKKERGGANSLVHAAKGGGCLRLCFHGNHWHRLAPRGAEKGNLAEALGTWLLGGFPGLSKWLGVWPPKGQEGSPSQTRGPSPLSSSTTIHQEIWQGPSASLRLSQPQT